MQILITGGSGFIGRSVLKSLPSYSRKVVIARKPPKKINLNADKLIIGDLNKLSNDKFLIKEIKSELKKTKVVLHIAGLSHKNEKKIANSLAEFRKVNRNITSILAKMASEEGVKRFVFISTIAVYGRHSIKPYNENDKPRPLTNYAISKLEAEQALLDLSRTSEMEIVIIRPPLIYGPNAPGNFAKLTNYVNKGIPLPFRLSKNKRSFIAIENLANFISLCLQIQKTPKAKNQIFLICDGNDISTKDLLLFLSNALNKKIYLFPVPEKFIKIFFKLISLEDLYYKLFESFQVSNSKAVKLLGWKPVISMKEQMKKISREIN